VRGIGLDRAAAPLLLGALSGALSGCAVLDRDAHADALAEPVHLHRQLVEPVASC
jgi:hypothetical protein